MKQYFVKLLTTAVIPQMILIGVIAAFLTNTHFNNQHAYRVQQLTGYWPIYAAYTHAIMSQRLIPILGLIIGTLLLGFRGVREAGLLAQGICAWLTAFPAYLTLTWLQWIRLHPASRPPFYPGAIRAAEFATLATIIAIAGGALLTRKRMKTAPNKASDATSEPAPGADSSAHQG